MDESIPQLESLHEAAHSEHSLPHFLLYYTQ